MIDLIWSCATTNFTLLDIYHIKKKFFQNLDAYFDFEMEKVLDAEERLLVNAILDISDLYDLNDILKENMDILNGIIVKAEAYNRI